MKRFRFIALLLLVSCAANAQNPDPAARLVKPQPTFADIQWGTGESDVRKQLTAKGFVVKATDKDGDLLFEGELLGFDAQGFAIFGDKKLVKFVVRILTPDNKAIEVYESMKEALTKKYGQPSNDFKYFRDPYFEGDGFELQAIRKEKANFSCYWGGALSVRIHETLTVQLAYESDAWRAEMEKRKAKETSVF